MILCEVDPLVCPKCGARMRAPAVVTNRQEIGRILEHRLLTMCIPKYREIALANRRGDGWPGEACPCGRKKDALKYLNDVGRSSGREKSLRSTFRRGKIVKAMGRCSRFRPGKALFS